jgi:hypothetical protein
MREVQIKKLSPHQMSRLRNHHPCLCSLTGEGMPHDNVRMSDANIQKLIKGAGKGKSCKISLSNEEIEDNKIHGTSLMSSMKKFAGSKAGQSLLKKGTQLVGNVAKKELKKRGVNNPLVDQLVDAGASEALKRTKAATGGNLFKSAMKAGKKFAGSKAGQNLMKQGAKAGTNLLKKEAKKRGVSNPLLDQVLDAGASEALKAANAKLEGGSFWGKKGHLFGKHSGVRHVANALKPVASLGMDMATMYNPELAPARSMIGETTGVGLYESSMGRGLTMSSMGRGLTMSSAGMRGGAIGARKGVLSVGNGGSFLHLQNPALSSNPYSANFFFNTHFPPSMQEEGIFGPYSGR